MAEFACLEFIRITGVLVIKPLVRVLGGWDAADGSDRPPETQQWGDELKQVVASEAGPVLLDLRAFEFMRNWFWFLVPLAVRCKDSGRRFGICVQPHVRETLELNRMDRLMLIECDYDVALETLSATSGPHHNEPG